LTVEVIIFGIGESAMPVLQVIHPLSNVLSVQLSVFSNESSVAVFATIDYVPCVVVPIFVEEGPQTLRPVAHP
jgi:hypothetical protein